MKFKGYILLGKNFREEDINYKGLFRSSPEHIEIINTSSAELLELENISFKGEKSSFIISEKKAMHLRERYESMGLHFDLLEVFSAVCEAEASINISDKSKEFLGYDIAAWNCYSLLYDHLLEEDETDNSQEQEYKKVYPLFRLIKMHFRPKLNNNFLLDLWIDANDFLKVKLCMMGMFPGLYGETLVKQKYIIFGISLLRCPESGKNN